MSRLSGDVNVADGFTKISFTPKRNDFIFTKNTLSIIYEQK